MKNDVVYYWIYYKETGEIDFLVVECPECGTYGILSGRHITKKDNLLSVPYNFSCENRDWLAAFQDNEWIDLL